MVSESESASTASSESGAQAGSEQEIITPNTETAPAVPSESASETDTQVEVPEAPNEVHLVLGAERPKPETAVADDLAPNDTGMVLGAERAKPENTAAEKSGNVKGAGRTRNARTGDDGAIGAYGASAGGSLAVLFGWLTSRIRRRKKDNDKH